MKKAYSIIVVSTMNKNHSQYIVSSVIITDRDGIHQFNTHFKAYTHTDQLIELAYKIAINNNYNKPDVYGDVGDLHFKNIHILLDNALLHYPYTRTELLSYINQNKRLI